MRAKKLSFAVGAAVVAMLMACGDDVSNVTEVNEIAALEMVKKYNRISVVVTGFDAKTKSASKYVTFTKGEEKPSEDDDFDE